MIINQDKFYIYLQNNIKTFLQKSNKSSLVIDASNSGYQPFHLLADVICPRITTKIWLGNQELSDGLAEKENAIILGQLSYEQVFFRLYPKKYRADFLPLGNLFQSEIQLDGSDKLPCPLYTWEQLEWACRQNIQNQILTRAEVPSSHIIWLSYTGPQKELIGKLWARRQATEHKNSFLPRPVLDRFSTDLVR